jgi:hypothetical protein
MNAIKAVTLASLTLALALVALDSRAMTQPAVQGYPFYGVDAPCFNLVHPGVSNTCGASKIGGSNPPIPIWVMPIVWQNAAYYRTLTVYGYQATGPTQVACRYFAFNTDGSNQAAINFPDFQVSSSGPAQANSITIPYAGPGVIAEVDCNIAPSQPGKYNGIIGLDYQP